MFSGGAMARVCLAVCVVVLFVLGVVYTCDIGIVHMRAALYCFIVGVDGLSVVH